jgi:Ger(x)C family germination protein
MRKSNFKCKLKSVAKHIPAVLYAVILISFTVLFFTNDFGVVDIHKTAVVSSVGIDVQDSNVKVTAQLAVPMPSQSGENVLHTPVVGQGPTFADALNDINSQTGFYPKLLFCRLIVLGESCQDEDIFKLLDWFYRDEYSSLTALVAMAQGEAGELLSAQTSFSDSTSLTVERVLSEELKKSANVSTVNLKILGQQYHSPSQSCYMPYLSKVEEGDTSQEESSGGQGAQSGQSGQNGQGGQSSQSNQSQGSDQTETSGFYCRKTAAFYKGKFVGTLTEEEATSLNLLKNNVKRAILSVEEGGTPYALGLRKNKKHTSISVENGEIIVTCNYSAVARIQNIQAASSPQNQARSALVPQAVLNAATQKLQADFQSLLAFCKQTDCDLLGVKTAIYRKQNRYYKALSPNLFSHVTFRVNVQLKGGS